jgi:glutathione S-transferase
VAGTHRTRLTTLRGPARDIVEQHEDVEADHVLYSGWFCVSAIRALSKSVARCVASDILHSRSYKELGWCLRKRRSPTVCSSALTESRTTDGHPGYQEINPYKKEASFLALNPRGLVPTLGVPTADGQKPLIESGIICEYLDETYPQVPLLPKDPYSKAKQKISIDYVTSRIIPAFHRFLQHTPEKPFSLEDARNEFLQTLLTFIKDADPTGPFFAGKDFGMADVILAPWAIRLWVFDHFKGGLGLPEEGEGGDDEELWKRWRLWAKAVEARPSVRNTMSDKQHYLPLCESSDLAMACYALGVQRSRAVSAEMSFGFQHPGTSHLLPEPPICQRSSTTIADRETRSTVCERHRDERIGQGNQSRKGCPVMELWTFHW